MDLGDNFLIKWLKRSYESCQVIIFLRVFGFSGFGVKIEKIAFSDFRFWAPSEFLSGLAGFWRLSS